jgi:2'-5' RNA ligase
LGSYLGIEKNMYYALVYNPEFDERTKGNIETFRRKYDSFVDYWEPHIPFIFPVPCSEVEETKLIEHIEKVLKRWEPFLIRIGGFAKSWDHWLLLLLKEGNEEVIALHDELYTGILSSYLRKDLEFIPHIGLALFAREDAGYNALDPKVVDYDEKLYRQALEEAESLKIDSFDIIDRLFLDKVVIKGKRNELLHKLIDRRTLTVGRTRRSR